MTVRISNMTAQFTNSSVVYTAIGMNANDSGSNANSVLIKLQTNSSDMFVVNKSGAAFVNVVYSNTVVALLSVNTATLQAGVINCTTINCTTINAGVVNTTIKIPQYTTGMAGQPGQLAWTANNLYVCVATNTWKSTPLA